MTHVQIQLNICAVINIHIYVYIYMPSNQGLILLKEVLCKFQMAKFKTQCLHKFYNNVTHVWIQMALVICWQSFLYIEMDYCGATSVQNSVHKIIDFRDFASPKNFPIWSIEIVHITHLFTNLYMSKWEYITIGLGSNQLEF